MGWRRMAARGAGRGGGVGVARVATQKDDALGWDGGAGGMRREHAMARARVVANAEARAFVRAMISANVRTAPLA
jgi:hypothetical protein